MALLVIFSFQEGILAGPSSAAAEFPAGTDVFVDVVNTTGVEDGSEANPFNTIQEGVNGASNGDVVGVAPGTYTEEVTVKIRRFHHRVRPRYHHNRWWWR